MSPWPTLEVLLALAPVRYQMGAGAEARELVDEARALLAEVPDAGALPARLAAVERATATPVREIDFGQRLTERELLILRMLDTHGSSREIGAQLYLSVNTVKTHTRSIYRKLGVSSRRGALERAQSLDLL